MRVIIVLYQNIESTLKNFVFYEDDFIVGVEKGIILLYNAGIKFHLGLGDFDSVTEEELNLIQKFENIYFLNREKDETDLLAALKEIQSLKMKETLVLGGIQGKRIEHFYSNALLMEQFQFKMIDDFSKIFLIDSDLEIEKEAYQYCSFFSLFDETEITLNGFKYALKDYSLKKNDTVCISNEWTEEYGKISVKKGKLMAILSH